MKPVILDTGVIVALHDRREKWHSRCVDVMRGIDAPLISCEAVITESCYLLREFPPAVDAVLTNTIVGIINIAFDICTSGQRVRSLMQKYSNVPMDFADACLVCLAEQFDTGAILTLDSDFAAYRWAGRRKFENLVEAG